MGAGDAKVIMLLLTLYPDPKLGVASQFDQWQQPGVAGALAERAIGQALTTCQGGQEVGFFLG